MAQLSDQDLHAPANQQPNQQQQQQEQDHGDLGEFLQQLQGVTLAKLQPLVLSRAQMNAMRVPALNNWVSDHLDVASQATYRAQGNKTNKINWLETKIAAVNADRAETLKNLKRLKGDGNGDEGKERGGEDLNDNGNGNDDEAKDGKQGEPEEEQDDDINMDNSKGDGNKKAPAKQGGDYSIAELGRGFTELRQMFQDVLDRQAANSNNGNTNNGNGSNNSSSGNHNNGNGNTHNGGSSHNGAPGGMSEEKEKEMRKHLGEILSTDRAPKNDTVC